MGQSPHLQGHVPLPPGDGDGPLQGLLRAFVVTFRRPEEQAVAREEAPSLVGIGRDQSKRPGDQLISPWESPGWDPNLELRGGHRLSDISRVGPVLEGAAQGGERFPKLMRFDCGGLGLRQSEQ